MDKILDKFYNGSIQKVGYNKPRLTSNKFSAPNLLENRYNSNGNTNNLRYSNGQRIIENSPVPRTHYSMGLQVPTIRGNPPLSQSVTNPFLSMNNPYSTIQHNYEPNKLKLNILDNRIREMEEENLRNGLKIQRLMEGSNFGPDKPYWNSNPNYVNNPNTLKEAMENLRTPYLTMEEYKNKQDMRRNIVQYELEKARQRIHEDNNINNNIIQVEPVKKEKEYTISNYSSKDEDENDSSEDEVDIKMKNEYNKLIKEIKKEREYNKMHENDLYNIEDRILQMERQSKYNNEELNLLRQKNQEMYNVLKSKEEAEDFINNIPDHVALQLQNDNFKIRSNLNSIKEGFREIKNDLENKLESLELKQNYNFEVIKKIIEEGGNRKMKAGYRKYINNEDIDLDDIKDELPEHLKFLPDLIERKIRENEEIKNQEKNRIINERMNKRFDNLEYNYGYANDFYKYKNNYKQFNAPNKNNNNNFVISKNYGRFQYIPNKNNNNSYNKKNSFKQNAEQNLMIMREKEKSIPGIYAYGVGNKNMDNRIPIRMNGCYDDWFKDKDNGEYKVEESLSEVGINAIKKKIKTKSNQTSLKSKEMQKSDSSKSKTESSKKKNKKKDKKDDKKENKKNKKKEESSKDEKSGEESGEESDEESKENGDEDKKDNKKKDESKDDENEEEEEGKDDKEESKKSGSGSDEEESSESESGDDE